MYIYMHTYTATYCNKLQHAATHCNKIKHTATYCNTLQYNATHCNILQHNATHCNIPNLRIAKLRDTHEAERERKRK